VFTGMTKGQRTESSSYSAFLSPRNGEAVICRLEQALLQQQFFQGNRKTNAGELGWIYSEFHIQK
jgi:hypothetical protein